MVRDGGRQRLSFYWFSPPPCLDSPVGIHPCRQVNIPTIRSLVLYSIVNRILARICVYDCSDSCGESWNLNSVSTWSCFAGVGNQYLSICQGILTGHLQSVPVCMSQ